MGDDDGVLGVELRPGDLVLRIVEVELEYIDTRSQSMNTSLLCSHLLIYIGLTLYIRPRVVYTSAALDRPATAAVSSATTAPAAEDATMESAPPRRCRVPMTSFFDSSGEPLPSRRLISVGSDLAPPPEAAACGESPTHASDSSVSPLRNLCARTPEVALPLVGNSENSLTLIDDDGAP